MRTSDTLLKVRDWAFLKALATIKPLKMDYEENEDGSISVFVKQGNSEFFVNLLPPGGEQVIGGSLTNDEDYADFINNYKPGIDANPPANVAHVLDPVTGLAVPSWKTPVTGDGKARVLASHKPIIPGKESYNFFTSRGDLGLVLGSGTALRIESVSGTEYNYVDVHFSTDVNPSEAIYIFGGGISWEDAGWGDEISLELRATPTSVVPAVVASGLGLPCDYNLVGDRIRHAGVGQGSHALGGYPKWIPNFTKTGYWDLDKVAMKAIPSVSGTGTFDWHTTEQFVGCYVQNLSVYKSNAHPIIIDATESAPLPYGVYLRLIAHNVSDTDWKVWAFMKMYRERLK
jgi:hypothetical protein